MMSLIMLKVWIAFNWLFHEPFYCKNDKITNLFFEILMLKN